MPACLSQSAPGFSTVPLLTSLALTQQISTVTCNPSSAMSHKYIFSSSTCNPMPGCSFSFLVACYCVMIFFVCVCQSGVSALLTPGLFSLDFSPQLSVFHQIVCANQYCACYYLTKVAFTQ